MPPQDAIRDLRLSLALLGQLAGSASVPTETLASRLGVDIEEIERLVGLVTMCGLPPYSPDVLTEVEIDQTSVAMHHAAGDAVRHPARLTLTEAEALHSALILVGDRLGPQARPALAGLCAKVEAALASTVAPEAIERTIGAVPGPEDSQVLADLWRAAIDCRTVEVEYHSASSGSSSTRRIDPWGVVNHRGEWYVVAWCHRAAEERLFKADRVRSVAPTADTFEPPATDALGRWEHEPFVALDETREATIRLIGATARVVGERWPDRVQISEGGRSLLIMPYASEAWLVRALLPYLDEVVVEGPAELRQAYRHTVEELARMYSEAEG